MKLVADKEKRADKFTIGVFDAFLELLNEISDVVLIAQLRATYLQSGKFDDYATYLAAVIFLVLEVGEAGTGPVVAPNA